MIRAGAGNAVRRVALASKPLQIQHGTATKRHLSTSIISRESGRGTVNHAIEMNGRARIEILSSSSALMETAMKRCHSSASKNDGRGSVIEVSNSSALNVSNGMPPPWYNVPMLPPIPIRGFTVSHKGTNSSSTMFIQSRLMSTGRQSRQTGGNKRARKVKKRPPVKRTQLRRGQKRQTPKMASRQKLSKTKQKQKVYIPVKARVKQKQERAKALRIAAASRRNRWTNVDVKGYSSALIEKYAVPPIETIKKLATVPTVTKGDLLSVLAVLSLLLTIIFTPLAARYVWKSDKEDYEELEWDDPVAQTEKDFRKHISEDLGEPIRLYLIDLWRRSREKDTQTEEQAKTEQESKSARKAPEERSRKAPRTILNIEGILKEILESPILIDVVTDFIGQVLESKRVNDALQSVLRHLWRDLINDPETTAQVVQLLHNGIQNREIKRSVRKLVLELINDKEVYDELQLLLIRLGNEQEVLSATQALLTESAHKALNDPEILDHSMAFATDVVGDDVVQRTSGEALRNTLSYAVRPGFAAFWAIAGVALLIFSFSALGNARSSEQEAEMIDRAFSSMARSLQASTASGVTSLLSLPGRILSFCASAVVRIVKAPFRLASAAVSAIGRAGGAASRTISTWVASIIAVPMMLFDTFSSLIASASRSVSDEISKAFVGLAEAVSSSFIGSAVRAVVGVCGGAVSAVRAGASAVGHAVATGVSGLSNAMASVVTSISAIGQSVSTHGAALWQTASQNVSSIGSAATHYFAQSKEFIEATMTSVQKIAGNSSEHLETMLAGASSFLKASYKAAVSWCERLLRRDQKPDPI